MQHQSASEIQAKELLDLIYLTTTPGNVDALFEMFYRSISLEGRFSESKVFKK